MRKSTYFRIFLATALIVFISFSLLGGLSTMLSYRRTMAETQAMMRRTLSESARYITTQHVHGNVALDDFDFGMWLSMTSRITGFDILLTHADGVPASSSAPYFTYSGVSIPDDILESVSSGGNSVIFSTLGQIYPVRRQIVGMPLVMSVGMDMRTYGYLFVTSDITMSREEWRNFSTAFILISLSVMFLAFVISFIASKKQAAPINEIAAAARRFARGEFDVRVGNLPDRQDEISQLTEAFNYMADALENNEQLRRDFIANLSHELRTPMTVIAGFAEGLLDGTIPKEDEARYLGIISSETRRLSRLVKSMLEISVLGETSARAMQDSSFDITEVAGLALLSLESRVEKKGLSFEAELPEEPIITRGNKDSITQVLYNLLDNAIKHATPGSAVKLELWQQGERVFVSVANSGEAIPQEELPNIFQRFHKVDKSRSADPESVGLGLYIVKAILDKLGEDIFVTSGDGVTKFIFSLTVAKG